MNPTLLLSIVVAAGLAATGISSSAASSPEKIRVILDTDANNELDDQHAIAYLLFNGDVFDVEAITVNRTRAGGGVDQHLAEAQRVVRLCGLDSKIPVLLGADKSFEEIRGHLDRPDFDGAEAVNSIIERAMATDSRKLVLLPVGKLTNIALALAKEPSIIPKVRVVWLGSNYPRRGEYNKENDVESLIYILETEVEFEIATVRYGQPSGTDAVRATLEEIRKIMPGKGPKVRPPVTGRHGGQFSTFGDYSVNLFENIRLYGDPPSRALFDMAAVAIVKNPAWATAVEMPAPILKGDGWVDRPDNPRKIILWENFNRRAIMADFYDRMENYQLASLPRDVGRIQPWFQDRRYWQFKGRPILPLGGSDQDNLSIALNYDHILYCISNESTASERWSRYWARFVRDRARQAGVNIEVTEMWNAHDLTDPMHRRTFDHPDLYSFVDTSQNNLRDGQTHWNNMQTARRMVADPPRPMNNNKIYGGSALGGGTTEGVNKFWRNILGGVATSRFHRPGPRHGFFSIGLSELAQTQIRSARLLAESFDVFRAMPDVDSRLLLDRQTNEAYLAYIPGEQYAVYFIDGGVVRLDLSDAQGEFALKWLDIPNTRWTGEKSLQGGRPVEIAAPGEGHWVALMVAR